jgi:FkbM family methyltransferase
VKELVKRLYKLIPFKRELFLIVRSLVKPSERIYKHLHFQGAFKVRVDDSHAFLLKHYGYQIENEIFWEGLAGGWERVSFGLWIKLAAEAKVVFDVGANTGVYALIAKAMNPSAAVYAFEPMRRIYDKLQENNALNNFGIICVEKAASNRDGAAIVYDTKADHLISVTVGKNIHPPEVKVEEATIEAVRLDNFISQTKLERLDLMKIDVETHEAEVLEGFGSYFERFRPTLLIEIVADEVGERVEELVKGKGYLYFNIDEVSGSIRREEHIRKSDYFNYLLCDDATAARLGLL